MVQMEDGYNRVKTLHMNLLLPIASSTDVHKNNRNDERVIYTIDHRNTNVGPRIDGSSVSTSNCPGYKVALGKKNLTREKYSP